MEENAKECYQVLLADNCCGRLQDNGSDDTYLKLTNWNDT